MASETTLRKGNDTTSDQHSSRSSSIAYRDSTDRDQCWPRGDGSTCREPRVTASHSRGARGRERIEDRLQQSVLLLVAATEERRGASKPQDQRWCPRWRPKLEVACGSDLKRATTLEKRRRSLLVAAAMACKMGAAATGMRRAEKKGGSTAIWSCRQATQSTVGTHDQARRGDDIAVAHDDVAARGGVVARRGVIAHRGVPANHGVGGLPYGTGIAHGETRQRSTGGV